MPKGVFIRTKEHNENIRKALTGKKKSKEHIRKMSIGMKGIGHPHTEEYKKRMSMLSARGSDHHNWKENNVSYATKHQWLHRNLGKANKCSNSECLKTCNKYEWANKTGEYSRNSYDYFMLCISCHRRMDYKRRLDVKRNSISDRS